MAQTTVLKTSRYSQITLCFNSGGHILRGKDRRPRRKKNRQDDLILEHMAKRKTTEGKSKSKYERWTLLYHF